MATGWRSRMDELQFPLNDGGAKKIKIGNLSRQMFLLKTEFIATFNS
jgi:hypothetical protein